MSAPDLIRLFVAPLNRLDIRYMVTGAVASVVYGEPRLTRDVDIVLELDAAFARRLSDAFVPADFYVPPLEVILAEARRERRGHFNLIHHDTALKADLYPVGRDPLQQWGLERRASIDLGGEAVWLAPVEYVILRKLEWYQEGESQKHLEDIRAMLRVSPERVNRPALDGWIAQLGLEAAWTLVSPG